MCALIQTRVSPSVSVPGFSVRIFTDFLHFPLEVLLLFPPSSMGREEHKDKLGWISCVAVFVPKLLLGSGILCVFITNQSMLTSPTIPNFIFTLLTQKKRKRSPFYSHFLFNSGLSIAFYWAEEPRKRKSERNLSSLFSPSTPAHLKSNFYPWQLSISSQKNTGSSWNYKHIRPQAKLSLARQWQKLPVDLSFMWCFFLLFSLRLSKVIATRIQCWILIVVLELKWEFSLMEQPSDHSWSCSSGNFKLSFIPVY